MTYQSELNEMAADIRKVDPNHQLGAGALAERLVELGWTKKNFGKAGGW